MREVTVFKLKCHYNLITSNVMSLSKAKLFRCSIQNGADYSERTAPIVTLSCGVFKDQPIFIFARECCFPRKL